MTVSDADYLVSLCKTTMQEYAEAVWGAWDDEKINPALIRALEADGFDAILRDGLRVGVLSVETTADALQIEDLYMEPAHQNHGIGTAVVEQVIRSAGLADKDVTLSVLLPNPAKRLYKRLGFKVVKTTDERIYMRFFQ